jgi:hypothetical protein
MDAPIPERRARSLLTFAIVLTLLGVALAGTAERTVGGVIALAGWGLFAYALHAFGRAGTG